MVKLGVSTEEKDLSLPDNFSSLNGQVHCFVTSPDVSVIWPTLDGLCSVDNIGSIQGKDSQLQDFHDISSLHISQHMKCTQTGWLCPLESLSAN